MLNKFMGRHDFLLMPMAQLPIYWACMNCRCKIHLSMKFARATLIHEQPVILASSLLKYNKKKKNQNNIKPSF